MKRDSGWSVLLAEPAWDVFDFRFHKTARIATVADPAKSHEIIHLPSQDIAVDGFLVHEGSIFGPELSSYLRYLQIHHILLFFDMPEIVHLPGIVEPEAIDDDFDDDGSFSYHTLMFRMPAGASTLPYFGFSFVDDQLYSSIYLDVEEYD